MDRQIAFVLSLGLTLVLSGLLALQHGAAAAATLAAPAAGLRVCPAGPPACDYASIQAAVDAANPGDVIKVAQGTYTGVQARAAPVGYPGPAMITQMVYINKTVTIRVGFTSADWATPHPDTNHVTLDAQRQGRVIFVTGDTGSTIEGLYITGGDANGLGGDHWGYDAGGGLLLFLWDRDATTTVSNNQVFKNVAQNGGGLYVYRGAPTLTANAVTSNTANGYGGGLFLYDSDATLDANTVTSNTANGGGGGLFLYYSDATLQANLVTSNTANSGGGGLFLQGGAVTLTNNVVTDNQANPAGSGLYLLDTSPRLLHSTIARNRGGDGSGLYVTGSSNRSVATLIDTILVSHTVGIAVTAGNMAMLESTLWYGNAGNWSGGGDIAHLNDHDGDPAFAADGYHLTAASAAISKGVDAEVSVDIDGEARPWGGGFDIGADEFDSVKPRYLYLPLVLRK